MKPNVGLNKDQRAGVVAILKRTLADAYVLSAKTRNFHWNVTGPHFSDLHKLFESQYSQIDASIDEIAENIRYFGEPSPGSLAEFLAGTRLKEQAGGTMKASDMLASLLADHETFIQATRKDIDAAAEKYKAADVADFLTGLLEAHEKMAWMLRSTLE